MKTITIMLASISVITAVVIACVLIMQKYEQIQTFEKVRNEINECDDIEFLSYLKLSEKGIEHKGIDDDGLNAEDLTVRRQVLCEMMNSASSGLAIGEALGKAFIKKNGQTVDTILINSNGFIIGRGDCYCVDPRDSVKLWIFSSPPYELTPQEAFEKSQKLVGACADIQFSIDPVGFEGGFKPDVLDAAGLNSESLSRKRTAIDDLFSECKPRDKGGPVEFTGVIYLKKDDKTILRIALYQNGFMMRGYYYDVLNPERNETMLRMMNFKKLKDQQNLPRP